jgi:hypothetical protein
VALAEFRRLAGFAARVESDPALPPATFRLAEP